MASVVVVTSGAASVAGAGIAADGAGVQLVLANANLWPRRSRRLLQ